MKYDAPPDGKFRHRGELRDRRAGVLRPGQVPTCTDGHKMPLPMWLHAGRGGHACAHRAESGPHKCNAMLYSLVDAGRVYVADVSYEDVKLMEQEHMDVVRIIGYLGFTARPFPDPPSGWQRPGTSRG